MSGGHMHTTDVHYTWHVNLEQREMSGVGYGNRQDTPESATGAKLLTPALNFISLSPYKSKLKERTLFLFLTAR